MILLNKPITKTPLEMLNKLREQKPELKDAKLAYAGRLDPMARGLLVVLVDEECKNRDHFQGLDKTYEFEVLFGVKTDTYDLLGLVEHFGTSNLEFRDWHQLEKKFQGTQNQTLPAYSSQPVKGKPLFWWAREGKLDEIEIPTKEIEIKELKFVDSYELSGKEILARVEQLVPQVKGDFRQEEIVASWQKILQYTGQFSIAKFSASVTSGTYIRSLAHDMGKHLGTNAIAWDINRLRVGEYVIEEAIEI